MKKVFAILIFCIAAIAANAQITTYWTSNINTAKLPTGATIPADTLLDGYTVLRFAFTVNLDAVTYDNATETTAWTAIGNATKTSIDSNWVEDVWALDPALDIIGRVLITNVERRFDNFELGNYPEQYTAATDIFRVTGYFEYAIEAP